RQRASEGDRERRLRMLIGREEQRVPLCTTSVGEHHAREPPFVVLQLANPLGADGNAVARQPAALRRIESGAMRADEDVGAPCPEPERELCHTLAATECGEAAIAALPPVAVRAMKHRSAVALIEAV